MSLLCSKGSHRLFRIPIFLAFDDVRVSLQQNPYGKTREDPDPEYSLQEDLGSETSETLISTPLQALNAALSNLKSSEWLKVKAKALETTELPEQPKSFTKTLYPHQIPVASAIIESYKFDTAAGFVLGDEMGLGKTCMALYALAKIVEIKKSAEKTAIICSASILDTWRKEIQKFVPTLNYVTLDNIPSKEQVCANFPCEEPPMS